jgi:hypothetical protein
MAVPGAAVRGDRGVRDGWGYRPRAGSDTLPADVHARLAGLDEWIENLQRQRAAEKKCGLAWKSLSKPIERSHAKAANITDNWGRIRR